MKNKLKKIYALYKSGLSPTEDLEELISEVYNIPLPILEGKWDEITTNIKKEFTNISDYQYRKLIYLNYLELFNELGGSD